MVPRIVKRFAGSLGGDPSTIDVVPNPPDLAVDHLALRAEHEAEAIEELTDVELNIFGELQVGAVEVGIVGQIMNRGNDGVAGVRQALRGTVADQVVVP